mgnify:CR=1 FL=1
MPTKARRQKEADRRTTEALFSNVPEYATCHDADRMNADLQQLLDTIYKDEQERLKSYQPENNAAQEAKAVSRLHDFAARYRDLLTKDKSARWVAIRIKDASDSDRSVEAIARDVRTVRKVLFTEKK